MKQGIDEICPGPSAAFDHDIIQTGRAPNRMRFGALPVF